MTISFLLVLLQPVGTAELAGGDAVFCLEHAVEGLRAGKAALLAGVLDAVVLLDEIERQRQPRVPDVGGDGDVQLPAEDLGQRGGLAAGGVRAHLHAQVGIGQIGVYEFYGLTADAPVTLTVYYGLTVGGQAVTEPISVGSVSIVFAEPMEPTPPNNSASGGMGGGTGAPPGEASGEQL